MKKTILPWAIALSCAIGLHLIVLELSQPQSWLPTGTPQQAAELFILKPSTTPSPTPSSSEKNPPTQANEADQSTNDPQQSPSTTANNQQSTDFFFNHLPDANTDHSGLTDFDFSSKPNLLQLEDNNVDMEATTEFAPEVFSKALREQIEQAKKDQQAYLKGQLKETEYQITQDADGTKYVNIEGVCWRIPEPGSEQAWAIVFAGCNGQTETFRFELNIAPSTFLGPDAIFPITE